MSGSQTNNLRYTEKKDHLAIRIEANKKYTNFNLEDWMEEHLPFKAGQCILDIACGSGNFFPCYAKKLGDGGRIMGVDQSAELLKQANGLKMDIAKELFQADMNSPLQFSDGQFDHVISTFAIYYVDKVDDILKEIHRVLKPGGQVILIGPTDRNASELYDFNSKVFGIEKDPKITQRSDRLEHEFYPAMGSIFKAVKSNKIPIKMIFPGREEFLRYYLATLLFEESVEKTGHTPSDKELDMKGMKQFEISKEMVVVTGEK